jgi:hypothetical protein
MEKPQDSRATWPVRKSVAFQRETLSPDEARTVNNSPVRAAPQVAAILTQLMGDR